MPDVLEKFLAGMGFALLEYRGDGRFRPISKLPAWFKEIWASASRTDSPIALSEQSPFLENFLIDAETFWAAPSGSECQSETWIEKSPGGREIPLQARALVIDGKSILALSSPDPQFREQVKILQTARNALLDHERLGREIQKKEILLHCIVHDLSQPLSVMHVAMDCLLEEAVSERSKQFLKLGKLASDQQETMIRDILHTFSADLRATLDAGTEGNTSPDILECARTTMTSLGPTFEAKGVRLALASNIDPRAPWFVRGEESRLQRIFANLLENALRYTPAGSGVTVGVEDEREFLRAYVDDEGPGLPKDLRPEQIFGLFMKGKQGGGKAGLGMYFCRITVERWGGQIGCVSLTEKGSRFWFRLPRAAAPALPTSVSTEKQSVGGNKPGEQTPPRPLRILLADDQNDIRTLTTYQLKRSGHKVVAVKNGRDALKAAKTSRFDVILLDQEMPGLTGDQVAKAIRATPGIKNSKAFLIASTGNTTPDDVRELKEAGFDVVLGKPFRLEDLNALLPASSRMAPVATPEASQGATPSTAPFEELVERVGGDEKLFRRMIQTFLLDTPKRMSAIAAALRRQDTAEVGSLAHALKGSVSIFGAEAARRHAQELQDLGRSGTLVNGTKVFELLKEEIANLQANLRGYANQAPTRPRSATAKRPGHPRKRGKRRR
jgi:signal transduction histidine kinase/HPt (histidine-containing phosphotransfer) domain-containing protein/ActR/RegA family two-component response regulator